MFGQKSKAEKAKIQEQKDLERHQQALERQRAAEADIQRKDLERQQQALERQRVAEADIQRKRAQREFKQKILAMLKEGKVPALTVNISVPFKLLKNERWLLSVKDMAYSEMQTKREMKGKSAGVSFRVMKGVSLRTGQSRGVAVETDVLTARGTGIFALSTKHIYFHGERSFRIALGKIVVARSTHMGLEIVRERASAQAEFFAGMDEEDAEFIAKLIHTLPDVDFGRGEPQLQSVNEYVLPFGDIGADDTLAPGEGADE